ncbi:sigma-54-dependent transcriptional regulator [Draconibacterium mangrovi]|uniref:sigma-54-dependent transcriptional regulator n=1 Tax=Draconibacterium mangrovi TaxID=2697469 RepID=UPI0013D68A70|nr:sigma-54 dependent transcriptional regulator [Draconibacterium mangrovi]
MKVLVVEDDQLSREAIVEFLVEDLKLDVTDAEDGTAALEILQKDKFELIISDIKMPGISGLELLKRVKQDYPGIAVILMTGFSEITHSIEALRLGAADYLLKPVNIDELAMTVSKIQERYQLINENKDLKESVQKMGKEVNASTQRIRALQNTIRDIQESGKMAVFSKHMKQVVDLSLKFHKSRDIPVLIQGETGTGKEMVARLIHFGEGLESPGPFIPVNCAAISEQLFESELFGYEPGAFTGARAGGYIGKMEQAQGGTLFLDEIGELPLEMQAKLLRVLQQRELYRVGGSQLIKLDVRFVFATNRKLKALIDQNKFRSDLFYRIETGNILLKPLREKTEEILPLAQYFLEMYSQRRNRAFKFISKPAASILEKHEWPGNVRELQNAIERVVLLFDDEQLQPWHLAHLFVENTASVPEKVEGIPLRPGEVVLPEEGFSIEELEVEIVAKAIKRFDGAKTAVAEYLGISRSALRSRLRKLEDRRK